MKKILVIDDDEDIKKIITIKLKSAGYSVATATDGYAGLQVVKNDPPDLMIVDLMMPDMSGWEFSQTMKQSMKEGKQKRIPMIILSALISEDGPPDDLEAGDYYMKKPFDGNDLLKKVQELLGEKKN